MTRERPLALAALLVAVLPLAASSGPKPAPRVQLALELSGASELGRPFGVTGTARLLVPGKLLRCRLEIPAAFEVLERSGDGAPADPTAAMSTARLRVRKPVAGAELRLLVEYGVADAGGALERREAAQSLFVTIDEHEGGAGMPGELWTLYLAPVAPARAGFVLRDYGAVTAGRGPAAEGLARYAERVAGMRLGREAAADLEALGRVTDDLELSVAARNAAAVARALAGEHAAAAKLWAEALATDELPGRVAAYLQYNRGIARWLQGEPVAAAADFRGALERHPGFSEAARALVALR